MEDKERSELERMYAARSKQISLILSEYFDSFQLVGIDTEGNVGFIRNGSAELDEVLEELGE